MSRFSLPRPSQHSSKAWRRALSSVQGALNAEAHQARQTSQWVNSLADRARQHPLADPDPGPPPAMPDMQRLLQDARQKAFRIGAITAGVSTWKESYDLYRDYKQGKNINLRTLAASAARVGRRSMLASRAASSRHLSIASMDAVVRIVAWQSARRASKSVAWKTLHLVSKKLSGRVGLVMMAAEVFRTMHRDIGRYRDGDLSEQDFYRNCALTGVGLVAPLAGASAGPVGGTVGIAVAIGAGMMRK